MDAHEMKRRGRGISRDMSPEGIARRLDIVGELWRMWRVLRQARPIGPVQARDATPRPASGPGKREGGAPEMTPS